jgi:hypothetical protein
MNQLHCVTNRRVQALTGLGQPQAAAMPLEKLCFKRVF